MAPEVNDSGAWGQKPPPIAAYSGHKAVADCSHHVGGGVIITLTLWLASTAAAEAIDITLAEVQNGVVVVQGNKAAKQATILWENADVGQTTKGGSFAFSGVVPADCVGQLAIGTDTVNVAVANCTSIFGALAPVPKTGQT